ncbi:MAG: DNA-binding response regulator [Firmicutes bacterium GWF2_51_9]|nr:MAG: DNA-binding response regulator [Firmicutes bacterium GWF2_51_9]OGS57333.1 MAG: DNA-binding response regulator [Firmicutes bacterium GWE2_51_13]HAM62534.1 DNA-binding response regulator [Erysipelotrichaceae bacterium]HBZ41444.1 DNA-binding response regulator [Erysipelotrichaceae bacterium]
MGKLIYIADDDSNIRVIIGSFLRNEGYEVLDFDTGDALLERFFQFPSDMVILDLMMSGSDGLTICRKLRERFNVPIIIVSARDSELDRITGITMGSDDYLVKPFSPVELVARVKALFRRISLDKSTSTSDRLVFGELSLNLSTRECFFHSDRIDLTPTELAFLAYMFQNNGRAVSRNELLKNVWKFDFEADTRATDDILKRLRKKIASSNVKIESVWGFGFKLALEEKK